MQRTRPRKRIQKTIQVVAQVLVVLFVSSTLAQAVDFEEYPEAAELIKEIVSEHGFKEAWVEAIVRDAVFQKDIIEAISRPAEKEFPWYRYKSIFVTQSRADLGVAFWERNKEVVAKAEKVYGVDGAVIVAIIGVETHYGRITGRHRVIDSLVTLTLGFPRRSEFFKKEFIAFLKLVDEEGLDPMIVKGSYAGAMGIPQFISSSYRHYAVDFNENGQRDLLAEPHDAIGSVANYLKKHGWKTNQQIYADLHSTSADALEKIVTKGLNNDRTYSELIDSDITLIPEIEADADLNVGVIKFETKAGVFIYRAGFPNFYVITKYNRSPLYAMAVAELANLIDSKRTRN